MSYGFTEFTAIIHRSDNKSFAAPPDVRKPLTKICPLLSHVQRHILCGTVTENAITLLVTVVDIIYFSDCITDSCLRLIIEACLIAVYLHFCSCKLKTESPTSTQNRMFVSAAAVIISCHQPGAVVGHIILFQRDFPLTAITISMHSAKESTDIKINLMGEETI